MAWVIIVECKVVFCPVCLSLSSIIGNTFQYASDLVVKS